MDLQKVKAWLPVLCGIVAIVGLFVPVAIYDYHSSQLITNAFSMIFSEEARNLFFDGVSFPIYLSVVQIGLGVISFMLSLRTKTNANRNRRLAVIVALIGTLIYMAEGLFLALWSNYTTTLAYIPLVICVILAILYYQACKHNEK